MSFHLGAAVRTPKEHRQARRQARRGGVCAYPGGPLHAARLSGDRKGRPQRFFHATKLLFAGVVALTGCAAVPLASPTMSIEAECAKMLGVPIHEVEAVAISLSKANETGAVAVGRMVWVTFSEREIEEEREVLRRLTTRVGSGEKASALKKEVLDVPKRQQRMRYWACQHTPTP